MADHFVLEHDQFLDGDGGENFEAGGLCNFLEKCVG